MREPDAQAALTSIFFAGFCASGQHVRRFVFGVKQLARLPRIGATVTADGGLLIHVWAEPKAEVPTKQPSFRSQGKGPKAA
jgi:hypothetical protein